MEGIFNNPSQQLGDERQGLRSRRLRLLGYAPSQAALLATTKVDIGQLERLIGLGCPARSCRSDHPLATRGTAKQRAGMTQPTIRDATGDDVSTVVELWREFKAQEHEPAWRGVDAEAELRELEPAIGKDIVLLAEREGHTVGLAVQTPRVRMSDISTSSTSAAVRDVQASPRLPSVRPSTGCVPTGAPCSSSTCSPRMTQRAWSTRAGAFRRSSSRSRHHWRPWSIGSTVRCHIRVCELRGRVVGIYAIVPAKPCHCRLDSR